MSMRGGRVIVVVLLYYCFYRINNQTAACNDFGNGV